MYASSMLASARAEELPHFLFAVCILQHLDRVYTGIPSIIVPHPGRPRSVARGERAGVAVGPESGAEGERGDLGVGEGPVCPLVLQLGGASSRKKSVEKPNGTERTAHTTTVAVTKPRVGISETTCTSSSSALRIVYEW